MNKRCFRSGRLFNGRKKNRINKTDRYRAFSSKSMKDVAHIVQSMMKLLSLTHALHSVVLVYIICKYRLFCNGEEMITSRRVSLQPASNRNWRKLVEL